MHEAEPAEVAASVGTSFAPLRSIQHKDIWGNPIVDPDRSNPTRSRWERPLETIRSFEAAIDSAYNNRRSMIRPDVEGPSWGPNRRGSYYSGYVNSGRFGHDSYYGSRPSSMLYANRGEGSLPDLRAGIVGQRDSYYEQQTGYGGYGPSTQNGRRGWPRMAPEPHSGSSSRQPAPARKGDCPIPSNHRSYETVTTAGSGSSAEPTGYQTDPTSSDNSSIERVQPSVPRQRPENDYGIVLNQSAGYRQPSSALGGQNAGANGASGSMGHSNDSNFQGNGAANPANTGPPIPQKDSGAGILEKPIANNSSQQARPAQPEKRKSWFARRFGKHG
ncbi:hypothetical protein VTH06DRAFT_528 [Thermothelomyces fergusii]